MKSAALSETLKFHSSNAFDENNSNFIPFSCSFIRDSVSTTKRAAISYEKSESAVIMRPAAWKRAVLAAYCKFFLDRRSAPDSSDEISRVWSTGERYPCTFPWSSRLRCKPDCSSRATFSSVSSASLPVFSRYRWKQYVHACEMRYMFNNGSHFFVEADNGLNFLFLGVELLF